MNHREPRMSVREELHYLLALDRPTELAMLPENQPKKETPINQSNGFGKKKT